MMLDPTIAAQRLAGWEIADTYHSYTRRDTALYALSVGVGHDPLDERQLALVDPWRDGLQALPSMALVLGYPGFWLGFPKVYEECGISPANVLHVEQSVQLHRPLPVEAEVVGRTHVLGLIDKGLERGALLYSERRIYLSDDQAHLATCRQVHYIRGFGGFGKTNFSAPDRRKAPTGESVSSADLPTRPEQALLYRLNGDSNPIHFDPRFAVESGFPRPILHGMCTAGLTVHAIVRLLADYDASRINAFTLRMVSPVFPGDTIKTEIWNDGSFRAIALERNVVVIDGGHALL